MNLSLTRTDLEPYGVFGELHTEAGEMIAVTLEHSYDCVPKIPAGTYVCVRSKHRLHGMAEDFETFEITGVAGHSNLLFHWGNKNEDSEGCVLLGMVRDKQLIMKSRLAFQRFMDMQAGVDRFEFTVM